jgi:hypothetical protein
LTTHKNLPFELANLVPRMAHSRKRSFRAPNVRFGPEQPREPWGVGRIAPPPEANRSTHWGESLHPLVRIAPPRPPEGVLVWAARTEQQPTNLRTHADQVQHLCRPTSAPVLNRSYLSLFLSLLSSMPIWGTPRGPIPQPDRSPPPCQSAPIRDFRPLIPAIPFRRLPGRLCT